jgi:2-amino-4-hydroxy-6-hydroxymethyldihydropteridine diphosphokinase
MPGPSVVESSPPRAGSATDTPGTVRVAIALGSNLGDRDATLHWALAEIASRLSDLKVSTFHDTAPVGVDRPQPRYLNAAATGSTGLAPRVLLELLLELERQRGRTREFPNAPRTLDLDLILYGDLRVSEPGLEIPHPRFRERAFVLRPLAEVAPDLVDPVTGKTIRELAEKMTRTTTVRE